MSNPPDALAARLEATHERWGFVLLCCGKVFDCLNQIEADLAALQCRRRLVPSASLQQLISDAEAEASVKLRKDLQVAGGFVCACAYELGLQFTELSKLVSWQGCDLARARAELTSLQAIVTARDLAERWARAHAHQVPAERTPPDDQTTPAQAASTSRAKSRNTGPAPSELRRKGRLPKAEGVAKRMQLLTTVRDHPTMKDNFDELAQMSGVSASTVRRWLAEEEEKYDASQAANAARAKH